jgi:hypothetical protein
VGFVSHIKWGLVREGGNAVYGMAQQVRTMLKLWTIKGRQEKEFSEGYEKKTFIE